MGFADRYIEKSAIYAPIIKSNPAIDLKIIVVIPCYNEPDIITSIRDLQNCLPTINPVEVIVHINSEVNADKLVLEQNLKTYKELSKLFPSISNNKIKFYSIYNTNLPMKHAGAGLARKIGMDEAIHRFNQTDNQDGVIVSFDADTRCDKTFLSAIEKQYLENPETNGSNVYFEHPIEGNEFKSEIYNAISVYELYLRYYRQSLIFTGYPYSYHTIGSIFNVKASIYTAQGGMNRKQAGEDFYFLQKIFPLGDYHEINSTCVYPSPRQSDRVLFGTGPMIRQIINDDGKLLTYSFSGFIDIKQHFNKTDDFYTANKLSITKYIEETNSALKQFLIDVKFESSLNEIRDNSSTLINFRKRYYKWFNALMILKYLNYSHKTIYNFTDIEIAAKNYCNIATNKKTQESSMVDLLKLFRLIDKN